MGLRTWTLGEPKSPEARYWSNYFYDLEVVQEILLLSCGKGTVVGKDFYADPLTFDGKRLPARLYGPELLTKELSEDKKSKPVQPWKIYVPDAPGRNKHWTIPEFFAAHITGKPITHLGRGEQMAWGLRALLDSGVVPQGGLPAVRSVRLPEGKAKGLTPSCKTLYDGILYLVKLRLLYNPNETEHLFAYQFMRRWCGIGSDSTVRNGLKWLRDNGYIRIVRREVKPGRANTLYYDLGAPSVRSLAKSKDAEGLIEVFRDFDSHVQEEASEVLIWLGPAAVGPLVNALADENQHVRDLASGTLLRICEPAVRPLIEALSSPDDGFRIEVLRTLCSIGGDEALAALIKALKDNNIEVQRAAIRELAWMKDERAVEPLRRIERQAKNPDLKHLAGQAANKIQGLPLDIW